MFFIIMTISLTVVAAVVSIFHIKIVPQSEAYVIERLGAYHSTWDVGLKFMLPYVDKIAGKISLKENVKDFLPQPVITADNVAMEIDTVIYYQIVNPKLYVYGVENPMSAIENLTATTLRNIIGDLELDETLTSRDTINVKMRSILDEATDPWGIKVNRVEVKNIIPPKDIQEAMEKQMRAERERREAILRAEGKKRSLILEAQGQKEAEVLKAQGEKEARILRSEAIKEQKKLVAEGESQAILNIERARAHGLKMLKAAQADKSVIALKSLDSLEKVADGKATKIIIPSELQDISGLVAGISEINNTPIDDENKLLDNKGKEL